MGSFPDQAMWDCCDEVVLGQVFLTVVSFDNSQSPSFFTFITHPVMGAK
jgi:hypothetical protein